MAYSTFDRLHTNKIGINSALYICDWTSTRRPDNTEDTGKLNVSTITDWKLLANVNTFQLQPETENDEVEYFDALTNTRTKEQNPAIIRRNMQISLVNYTPLFDAILKGVPNAMSEDYGAGEEVPAFANNDPQIPVCVKMEQRGKGGELYQTLYFYGKIIVTDSVEYNGKIVQPQVNIEVQTSVHNVLVNEAAFTGQTQTP